MDIYGKKFLITTFNLSTISWEKLTAEVIGQLSGPYNEDFVTVMYSDGAVKDMPISSFLRQVDKELD
jgi:hypothetical protein